MKLTFEFTW
jgi:hypothetical protein